MAQGPSHEDPAIRFEAGKLVRSAQAALGRGNAPAAVDFFLRAVRLLPKDASLRAALGDLYQMLMRPVDAEAAYLEALRNSAREPRALAGLASVHLDAGQPEQAADYAARALEVAPTNTHVRLVLARALSDLGRFSEADAEIRRVLSANPDDPVALYIRGGRFRESGKFTEARRDFLRAVELNPGYAAAYWGYAQCGRVTGGDGEFVKRLEAALAGNVLDRRGTIEALFSLGKVNDDLGRYQQAMESFVGANRMRDQDIVAARPFRKDDYVKLNSIVKQVLNEETIRANRVEDPPNPTPIFVVGMLRSGTTLVEQIVSSHSLVAPGGEIRFWTDELPRTIDSNRNALNRTQALSARAKYLARLKALAKDLPFVTDKMPENFRVLGLIAAMFPTAKIIHCARHPVDTCLSIYFTPFHDPPHYSADPEKLVFTYGQYLDLMDHWRQVLPTESILDVQYAELIHDSVAQTRRIVEFCGLPWDEACLRPEANERAVSTASAWQARQPIYKTSMERWRNYEPWLDGFRPLLALEDTRGSAP